MRSYSLKILLLIFGVGFIVLTACSIPTRSPDISKTQLSITPSIQVLSPIETARQALAGQLGIDPSQIEVHAESEMTWPDSCLGFPRPAEHCRHIATPGYGGMLTADDLQFEFRTDASGNNIRFIPGAALFASQLLAQQVWNVTDQINILEVQAIEWPDACLGVLSAGRVCNLAITPGYRVVLEMDGKNYQYNTDQSGNQIILAEAPEPEIVNPFLTWSQTQEDGCKTAYIGTQGLAFGLCGGPARMEGRFVSDVRTAQAIKMVDNYLPFEADTLAGRIIFDGKGTSKATPGEQRWIAEWARMVSEEAYSGRSGASWGLVFTFHQEGGLAGFCDDLSVYVTGEAYAGNCKGDQAKNLGVIELSSSQLNSLYGWLDRLTPFESQDSDPASADGFTTYIQFFGNGNQEPTDDDLMEIQALAQDVLAQVKVTTDSDD